MLSVQCVCVCRYLVHPAGFQADSGLQRVKLLTKDQPSSALDTITPPQGGFTQGSHALHEPKGDDLQVSTILAHSCRIM